ncbi:MAG: radical SAM protein, partial [Aureliella sp.]
ACRYCGFSREVLLPRREIDADQLLAFGQALSEFQTATGRPVLVSWLGGEPYQWSQLWPVSERFQRQYGLSLGITTNGNALASQQIRQQTKLRFDQLTLSVDGLAADHDAVRQRPGGYMRLRESCQRLREEDSSGTLWIRVNMVLMRSNIAHFAGACRELIAWGVNEVTFNQLGGNDRPEFYPENCLLPEQVAAFRAELPKLREEFSSHGVRIAGSDHYLSRIAATTAGRRMPIEDCRPGTRFLFVDEAGQVSPCSFTSRSCSVTMTQLTAGHQITDLPQMLAERRAAAPIAACRDCHATHMFDKFERVSEDRNISSPRSPRPPR